MVRLSARLTSFYLINDDPRISTSADANSLVSDLSEFNRKTKLEEHDERVRILIRIFSTRIRPHYRN